ncbi:MAG: hypothetical protein ACLRNQ_15150 [Flavonifractor plautii]
MAQRRRIRKKKRVSPLRRAGKLAYRILVVLSAIIVVLYCAYRLASKKPTQAPEPTPEAPAYSSPRIRPKRLAARGGRDIHFSAGRQRPVQRQRRHHHCGLLRH